MVTKSSSNCWALAGNVPLGIPLGSFLCSCAMACLLQDNHRPEHKITDTLCGVLICLISSQHLNRTCTIQTPQTGT